jgi:acyl-CoA reductase-like NAD-dependent aldehyde dehydrogenase
VGNH